MSLEIALVALVKTEGAIETQKKPKGFFGKYKTP